jgi:hypothetical protein
MPGYLYAGESDGGRIVRFNDSALTQITTAGTESVLSSLKTWDVTPAGPAGDCVFRNTIVTIAYSNGYSIRVTPYVDGVALSPQTFSGSGADTTACQAFIASRGARCAVLVEQLTRTGDLEWVNVGVEFTVIRRSP